MFMQSNFHKLGSFLFLGGVAFNLFIYLFILLLLLLLFFFTLQYCIGFAIHQHASAMWQMHVDVRELPFLTNTFSYFLILY